VVLPIGAARLILARPGTEDKMKEIPAAHEAAGSKTAAGIGVALALVTICLYWPAMGHSFIDYDDDDYVTANPVVREGLSWRGAAWALTTGHSANWHPLTWLSHMLDCSCFGLNPAGHHATSIAWHAANTVLLFFLLRRMTGALWRAAAVAALFAWHPLRVESVAWVSERKDVLSAFFFLGTIWFYTGFARQRRAGNYLLALLCFALGLMSKPMVVTLPFVLLLLDYWPLDRFAPGAGARLALEKAPFFALSAVSCVVTYLVQKHAGAVSEAYPFYFRAENALLSYGRYLGRTLWPARLSVIYPYHADWPRLEMCGCWLLLVALTWLALGWRRRRYLAAGWFWYLGMLVPVIGLVQAGSQASADRYTYLPSIGIFLMIVWGAADLADRWRPPAWAPALAGTLALAACAAVTEAQLRFWSDSAALFGRALAVTTDNYVAWNNLGKYYLTHGKNREALRCFTSSLLLREDAVTWRNTGRALAALQRRPEAERYFARALALDPTYIPARMSLADSLADDGKNEAAARLYQEVLRQDPDQEDAYCNLACVLAAQGNMAGAMTELAQALRLRPSDASAHCNMGNLLMDQGKLDQAAAEYRTALRFRPGSPEIHSNLGAVLALQGRRREAMEEFTEALRLAPNFTQARERLKALTDKD